MQHKKAASLAWVWTFLLCTLGIATAAEVTVHSLATNPSSFDHQTVTLQGTAVAVKETTSRRGDDYTTFKLQDQSGSDTVSIFAWGHPALTNGDHVRADGVFETEHHQGPYTFHNEVEATKVTPLPR
jgi:hypothetical protein